MLNLWLFLPCLLSSICMGASVFCLVVYLFPFYASIWLFFLSSLIMPSALSIRLLIYPLVFIHLFQFSNVKFVFWGDFNSVLEYLSNLLIHSCLCVCVCVFRILLFWQRLHVFSSLIICVPLFMIYFCYRKAGVFLFRQVCLCMASGICVLLKCFWK